jgi:hypothetical protein
MTSHAGSCALKLVLGRNKITTAKLLAKEKWILVLDLGQQSLNSVFFEESQQSWRSL